MGTVTAKSLCYTCAEYHECDDCHMAECQHYVPEQDVAELHDRINGLVYEYD